MAATTLSPIQQQQWHPGEQAMHRLLRVPRDDNPTFRGLAPSHGHRISQSPVVALGTLDGRGRPWAALWGGERGFCRPVADGVLGVRAVALDVQFDPVLGEVLGVEGGGEDRKTRGTRRKEIVSDQVVHPDADEGGKLIAALAIDLETRDRVKFAGRALAGAVSVTATATAETEAGGLPSRLGDLQMAIRVEETLGNCPKYLNKKRITPHVPSPRLVSMGVGGEDKGDDDGGGGSGATQLLSREAIDLVERADLFFIASRYGSNGEGSMDVNHRGGAPGFMRVLTAPNTTATTATTTTTALVYPEYSGNRLYQTLGNLHSDPRAGLAIPDFATGDVLYVTGRASILLGEDAAAACLSRRAKLALRVDVEEARLVRDGLPFRGEVIDFSPYNPPAPPVPRRQGADGSPPTRTETGKAVDGGGGGGGGGGVATATLVDRHVISPSVARYVFKLSSVAASDGSCPSWRPGQHVTLAFGAELDHGWSHMRDDDPQSLNDDFVRTFTVSSSGGGEGARAPPPNEFEITVRRHGPATGLLAKWNLRVPLELPVLGFGGAEGFRLPIPASPSPSPERESVFVAAGVGITPLMAQAADVLRTAAGDNNNADGSGGGGGGGVTAPLRVLWSLKREDLPLAVHVLKRIEGLGKVTRLFVTGGGDGELEGGIRQLGAVVTERRMGPDDVLATGEKGNRRFYCCTGPEMMKALLQWTEGEEVVFESFNY